VNSRVFPVSPIADLGVLDVFWQRGTLARQAHNLKVASSEKVNWERREIEGVSVKIRDTSSSRFKPEVLGCSKCGAGFGRGNGISNSSNLPATSSFVVVDCLHLL
jgi:hypothetical protein